MELDKFFINRTVHRNFRLYLYYTFVIPYNYFPFVPEGNDLSYSHLLYLKYLYTHEVNNIAKKFQKPLRQILYNPL